MHRPLAYIVIIVLAILCVLVNEVIITDIEPEKIGN